MEPQERKRGRDEDGADADTRTRVRGKSASDKGLFSSSGSGIGFGCMGMTAFYGPAMSDESGTSLLAAIHDGGVTHFDTAEVYQQFDAVRPGTQKFNEALIGQYLRDAPRDSFTVATKYFPALHDGRCDYASVSAAVDASLSRLGLEQIDLYYCHRMPDTVLALEEWMASMKRVVASGRVRHVGLSEAPAAWLERAHAVHPIAAVQQEWSLLTREPCESEVVPICRQLGISIVAYSPLARNLLSDPGEEAPGDWRANQPRYAVRENYERNVVLSRKLAALAAAQDGASSAQLSLAWLIRKASHLGVTCVPIPGSTSAAHVLENMKGAALAPRLTEADMDELEALGATVAGERGNESYMKMAIEGKR